MKMIVVLCFFCLSTATVWGSATVERGMHPPTVTKGATEAASIVDLPVPKLAVSVLHGCHGNWG